MRKEKLEYYNEGFREIEEKEFEWNRGDKLYFKKEDG
jgi:hypothetical protein